MKLQPVRIMAVVLAVLGFLTGAAGLADLIPKVAMAWLVIVYGVVQVAWGAWTATQVTPLANPKNAAGRALVPLLNPPSTLPTGGSVTAVRPVDPPAPPPTSSG